MWAEFIDPKFRHEALALVDDELGYTWLSWRGKRIVMGDVYFPGEVTAVGLHHQRAAQGLEAEYNYDEVIPEDYWSPTARLSKMNEMGIDEAVIFPNFGLFWERLLSGSLEALTANMGAWNRFSASVVSEGDSRLHGVAHLTLRDPTWLKAQLRELEANGIRIAMIAPSLVDGKPLSHPDHEWMWSAFVDSGVVPAFHVADQQRPFDLAWYTDPDDRVVAVLESVLLSAPPQLAVSDLIINGVLERHPELQLGIFELGATWIPLYLTMLDEGWDFITRLNGRQLAPLRMKPSDYFRAQVRVAAFSHEKPGELKDQSDDLFMCCSDYPHAEGTATPVADYAGAGLVQSNNDGLFADNIGRLLGTG